MRGCCWLPRHAFLLPHSSCADALMLDSICCQPQQAQDDELEDPLLEDFKALRRKLFAWQRE